MMWKNPESNNSKNLGKHATPLSGIDNDRLEYVEPMLNEGTAAWANTEKVLDVSQVCVPSESNVDNAKRWVDNGSRL